MEDTVEENSAYIRRCSLRTSPKSGRRKFQYPINKKNYHSIMQSYLHCLSDCMFSTNCRKTTNNHTKLMKTAHERLKNRY